MNRRTFFKSGVAAMAGMSLLNVVAKTTAEERLFVKRFFSPDELSRYTRLDALTQPLLMVHMAGYSPQGGLPECAIESAEEVPNIKATLAMMERNIPALLDLSRADRNLQPDQLDWRFYTNAVKEGFPMLNTNQYKKVLEILKIKDWA